MALNLVTRQEYKKYIGISSTTQDAKIDLLLPRVSQFVKNYCRRTFVDYVDDPTEQVFNGGTQTLILAETPVIDIVSVEYSVDYGQTYAALVEYSDWVLNEDTIYPTSLPAFAYYLNGYKVTYTAGYDDVPYDLTLAVMDLITYYSKNEGAVNAIKHTNTTSMQIEYISDTALPAYIKRVLDIYISDYT